MTLIHRLAIRIAPLAVLALSCAACGNDNNTSGGDSPDASAASSPVRH
jgi:hypothetical protein